MKTRHSIPLSGLSISLAVVLASCGSDYGGLLGVDGGGLTADAAADARADVPTTDASVQADTDAPSDGSTTSDQSTQPDLSTPPPPDVSSPDGIPRAKRRHPVMDPPRRTRWGPATA